HSAKRRKGNGATGQTLIETDVSFNAGSGGSPTARGRMSSAALHWDGRYLGIKDDFNASNEPTVDVVQTLAVPHGDVRLLAAKANVVTADNLLVPHRNYGKRTIAHSMTNATGGALPGFDPSTETEYLIVPTLPIKPDSPYRGATPIPFATSKSKDVQLYGDFDNGAGLMIDGPYINKPDEGNVHALKTKFTQEIQDYWDSRRDTGDFPYYSNPEKAETGGPAYFSPNRLVSGPGMFGSLPTGVFTNPPKPWQTLLFRPDVAGNHGYAAHPGANSPPDHLIMDLFWMPVVEPYAISEPLSTGGKVNMNYQMVPFFHVHRDTALRGVVRSDFMVCVPNQWHSSYKHNFGRGKGYHWKDNPYGGAIQTRRLRTAIVEDKTLAQFDTRFENGLNMFKSATEICEIHLVPEEVTSRMGGGAAGGIGSYTPPLDQMKSGKYWRDHSLVGDNSRERPYTNIQTRLTTKSNTFLVHYRAQVLKQSRRDSDAEYGEWRPEIDQIQAEYRGSSMVERYVDPNSDDIPDFATEKDKTLDVYYRYRVVNPRRFAP
ncbi:MAG: Verru_Chthon cassette protein A, partial [Verrucomicrobiales bacterium]